MEFLVIADSVKVSDIGQCHTGNGHSPPHSIH